MSNQQERKSEIPIEWNEHNRKNLKARYAQAVENQEESFSLNIDGVDRHFLTDYAKHVIDYFESDGA